tara:strand:- start:800 stop:2563 length:1764 start_codon:yes stop_codon:yes gene_type:complete
MSTKKNTVKQDYKDSIRVVNMSSYQVPEIKEVHNKDWVSFGNNNDYFDNLIDRYLDSPTNGRCINGIVDMIYGRGLESTNSEIFPEDYIKMKKLLRPRQVKRLVNDYKLLGQGVMQLTYNKAKTRILKVSHFPMETLRAEKATKGKVKAYYYHPSWKDYTNSEVPKRIPTFGNGTKSQLNELYVFKPYRSGFYYYSTVDYQSSLQYSELESEVSNYHISNIQNGLQPSLFVNFNNGIPNSETQAAIENKINEKFSGSSNSGKAIIAFNESAETKADIEAIHLPDAHAQYQFLSDEAREKIMLGHGIVSPILLGIKDNTGFGNNAEELRTASVLMDNVIIRPLQDGIIYGLNEILEFNNIHQDLYFVTLQPIEFTELENVSTKIRKEEETGEKLSAEENNDFSEDEGDDMINQLEALGEVLSDDWDVIHSEIYQDENESVKMAEIKYSDKPSSEDDSVYKIRYAYMPERKSPDSRDFCKRMELLTGRKVVFRKEDINMMSFRGVNKELGHKGANYSLLKFKGGKNCHHYWELRVYKKKGGKQTNAQDAYEKGLKEPKNPSEMGERMIDRADKGAYRSTLSKIRNILGL